jgi:microcystin degradation protein MlrC
LILTANLTEAMLKAADVLIAFKEYPHSDSFERAEELWRIVVRVAEGCLRPVASVYDCRMLTMFFTTLAPSAHLVRLMCEAEQEPRVLSVSLAHGFPWGDVPDAGAKVLVYTDADPALGDAHAERIGRAVIAARGTTTSEFVSPAQAVARALAWNGPAPLVLADTADNVGGGAPGDSTLLLGPLLEAGVSNAAAAFIFHPVAVQIAASAGVGTRIPLRVGGKASARSGAPLDLDVEVRHVAHSAVHEAGAERLPLGDVAVVRATDEFDLVLTSIRCQCYHRRAFQQFGVDPRFKRVLLVKSMQHFVGGFGKMAGEIVRVDSEGAASLSLEKIAYALIDRGMWPFGEGDAPDRAISFERRER